LSDASANVVADDARVVDSKRIEETNDALGVPANGDVFPRGPIAAAITQQIDNDDTMTLRNQRNYIGPEVRGSREPMEKHDRLAGSTRTGSVVVESRAVDVDKLTSHEVTVPCGALLLGRASMAVPIEFTWQDVRVDASSQANGGRRSKRSTL
jgi:hypothetical protein